MYKHEHLPAVLPALPARATSIRGVNLVLNYTQLKYGAAEGIFTSRKRKESHFDRVRPKCHVLFPSILRTTILNVTIAEF